MVKSFWTAFASALLWAGAAMAQMPAACPSEPMQVVRSRGGVVNYLGTVPTVPDLCRMQRADGIGAFFYGSWRADWPGAGEAYPAIKQVVLGKPGDRIDFVTRSIPGMQWVDSFINEGREPLVVDGVSYTTLRLAHERKGIEGNTYHSVITVWRDVGTGVTLRVNENQIAGQSYGPDTTWRAVRVTRLPPTT